MIHSLRIFDIIRILEAIEEKSILILKRNAPCILLMTADEKMRLILNTNAFLI